MITEDYVSFETAKLLKEKGFDEYGMYFYTLEDEGEEGYKSNKRLQELAHNSHPELKKRAVSCPTLQMAMKWLREKHKLGVFPTTYYREMSGTVRHDYGSTIVRLDSFEIIGNSKNVEDYTFEADTYEETADKAIRYCLENLI